jgi:uncharacterized membrane protein YuzA (DUF378 family)
MKSSRLSTGTVLDERTQPARSRRGERILAAIIVLGIALRAWQYLADLSMWFDELSIARNITERSFAQLLGQPLAFAQSAPLGFIAVIEIASHVFGSSDMALRLFPFVCGIASLFVFRRVAEHTLEGAAVPIAVGLFAISAPLIRYSAELKQYGGDVVVILLLTLVALDLCTREPTLRRCVVAGVAGLASAFFSQIAVMVLAGLGAVLVLRWMLQRDAASRRPAFVTVPIWALASLGGLFVARHYMTARTMEFMHWFWRSRHGFLPLPPTLAGSAIWARDRVAQFFDAMSGYPIPLLYTTLALAGFVVLWRRRDIAHLLAGPFLVTFAAAVAQQYPFRMRVVLFLLPTFLLTAAASVGWLIDRASTMNRAVGVALGAALLIPPVAAIALHPPPYTSEPFKPVLAYVRAHRHPGDQIYVYSNAFQAITRYGAQYGMSPGSYVTGACDEQSMLPFLTDVDRFRGAPRVWVIASSVPDFKPARQAIDKYLSTIGVKRDSMSMRSVAPFDPVSAELFDLSDTMRLRTATAESAEPPRTTADTLHALCFDWVRPTPGLTAQLPR